jgi:hypothetical protein
MRSDVRLSRDPGKEEFNRIQGLSRPAKGTVCEEFARDRRRLH